MGNDAKILTGVSVFTIIIVLVAAFTIGNKPKSDRSVLGEAQKKILLRQDSFLTGNPKAKVTVVEFGDFECPACGAADIIVRQILKAYKDKIALVFREFPLPGHKNGYTSAVAAEAAGAQGKFWQMHDLLYDRQNDWSGKDDPADTYVSYAKKIGLNVEQFKKDYAEKKYDSRIQADLADGSRLGITATPTFFIDGEMVAGLIPYDDFKSKIDEALAKQPAAK